MRDLRVLYDLLAPSGLNLRPRYNGAPTQSFAACRLGGNGKREIANLHWGLVTFWAKGMKIGARLINARSETVERKPSFRSAFRARRCLVPANGWFEWKQAVSGKQPFHLTLEDGSPLSFAGLWE